MSQIKQIIGQGVPVVGNDIDTDRIIPARFLRCVTFDGLGEQAFADDRTQAQGEHPFDLSQYQNANILVVNANFGCGSSREHAPQSLSRWGIKAIIGESFAEIFLGNCTAIGVPCVTASADIVQQIQNLLQDNPEINIQINLETMTVVCGDLTAAVAMNPASKQMFIKGTWDNCGQLVQNESAIQTTASNLPYLTW
ncbi:MAG: 3-isopropylmalate dehydratase small subunit [Xenococcaceae cyanobacterium MO_207.B15]|nr:3-isopropylmalate dehydratase small subunit [Xenococcaceae cyanobacterium MO_207.B15]MDJ0742944.1 3-isopropylmalate dehydratase small subunit [Xenococcaceae cyanobacterium MO_167.B27]